MASQRDENGRYTKQYPSTTKPLVEAGIPPFELTTPIARKPILEELEEKQHSRQSLTLVERHTLLTYEVKRKQKQKGTSSIGKQRETRKPIDQPILEKLDQPILEQLDQPIFETIYEQTKQVENTQSQFVIEI